jgi:uncharacterized protein (UPF0276 family)
MNSSDKNFGLEALGGGVGLRHAYFNDLINGNHPFSWFEIITEDFLDYGGYEKECLLEIRKRYPIIAHGVCMSVGSTDPLDMEYLKKLKTFLREIDIPWASDHLCFTMVDHTNLNELIPLPFTQECVGNCVERLRVIQDTLELPFLVENVTRYVTLSDREMSEAEFVSAVIDGADCGLLLDVTNVFLNGQFHGYNPDEFISSLPLHRVGQIHLAGWEPAADGTVIDSHDAPVPDDIWELFERTIEKIGSTSVLVERDSQLPPITELLAESKHSEQIMQRVQERRAA